MCLRDVPAARRKLGKRLRICYAIGIFDGDILSFAAIGNQIYQRVLVAALDVMLPHTCPACDQQVAARGLFCAPCFAQMTLITQPFCHCCGVPFESRDHAGRTALCEQCRSDPPEYGRARSAFLYDDRSRGLVLALKHGDRIDLAQTLAPFMARAGQDLLADADYLVPVPLHRRRLIARRYNQAALLAREVARLCGKRVVLDGLRRIRVTQSLGHLGREERAAELAGAFALRERHRGAFEGRKLVLIDDVITSGATLRGCARVLLAAGAARVDALTVAHVL